MKYKFRKGEKVKVSGEYACKFRNGATILDKKLICIIPHYYVTTRRYFIELTEWIDEVDLHKW